MRLNTTAPLPQLQCIPAFSDNYIWLLHDGQYAWVVTLAMPAPCAQRCRRRA